MSEERERYDGELLDLRRAYAALSALVREDFSEGSIANAVEIGLMKLRPPEDIAALRRLEMIDENREAFDILAPFDGPVEDV